MNPHITTDTYGAITQRLTAIDSEIRSIRATLFQLAEAQGRLENRHRDGRDYRTAEDFLHQPD